MKLDLKASEPAADLRLIESVLAGEPEARERLASRLACVWPILEARNRRHGGRLSAEDLANVAQDVLLALWERLDRYRGTCTLETWVYSFCELTLRNALRRAARRGTLIPVEELALIQRRESDPTTGPLHEGLYDCLERLEPEMRELVLRKCLDGTSFAQIGRSLGVSPNTLKSRYLRAIEQLRDCLGSKREPGPAR